MEKEIKDTLEAECILIELEGEVGNVEGLKNWKGRLESWQK